MPLAIIVSQWRDLEGSGTSTGGNSSTRFLGTAPHWRLTVPDHCFLILVRLTVLPLFRRAIDGYHSTLTTYLHRGEDVDPWDSTDWYRTLPHSQGQYVHRQGARGPLYHECNVNAMSNNTYHVNPTNARRQRKDGALVDGGTNGCLFGEDVRPIALPGIPTQGRCLRF